MSDALLGVLIGALIAPILDAVGYLVRRQLDKEEKQRGERRDALVAFQDALLVLSRAEAAYRANEEDPSLAVELVEAKRRIRMLAARVRDAKLWKLVNTPHQRGIVVDEAITIPPPDSGEPGDRYDGWNERVRELFDEL